MNVRKLFSDSCFNKVILKGKIFALTAAAVTLAACASGGPEYVASAETGAGGYSSQKLDDNQYRVSFSGGPGTPVYIVQDYALLRAAEITIENNYASFSVAEETIVPQNAPKNSPPVTPSAQSYRSCRAVGCTAAPYAPSFARADAYLPAQRLEYTSSLVIFMLEESVAENSELYDAEEVVASIRRAMDG